MRFDGMFEELVDWVVAGAVAFLGWVATTMKRDVRRMAREEVKEELVEQNFADKIESVRCEVANKIEALDEKVETITGEVKFISGYIKGVIEKKD